MTNEEIKKLSAEELKANIAASETRLQKMKFSHALTPLANPMEIRTLRKHIARLYTEAAKKQNA